MSMCKIDQHDIPFYLFSRPKMYFFVLLVKFWHDINFCSILFRERATTAHQATEEGGMDGGESLEK